MSDGQPNPYQSPTIESTMPFELELASRLTRLGARLVDGLIGMVLSLPVMLSTDYIQRVQVQQVSFFEIILWGFGGLVVYVLLHGYFLATRGQTLGKMLLGIRIVDIAFIFGAEQRCLHDRIAGTKVLKV